MKIDSISGDDFYRVIIRHGFMETPGRARSLDAQLRPMQAAFNPMDTTYFVQS